MTGTVTLILALLLLAAPAGVLLAVGLVRHVRKRRRARHRVVERPNSHYVMPPPPEAVRPRHRWEGIDLARVHEINRGEVVRLLERAVAGGVGALRSREQAFLDQIARIAGPPPTPPQSDPRHHSQSSRILPAGVSSASASSAAS